VLKDEARNKLPADGYASYLQTNFEGLKIGFLDLEVWRWPPHVQKQENGTLEQIVSVDNEYLQCSYYFTERRLLD